MTIFEALRDDHDSQRTLIEILLKTEGDSDGRREVFDRLRTALEAHAAAEERHFYAPLMQHDVTQDAARHSVAEHHELDELIEQLEGYDMSASQWLVTARELGERLVHHLDEEEAEVFPVAGRVLDDDQKRDLGEAFRADMERRTASS